MVGGVFRCDGLSRWDGGVFLCGAGLTEPHMSRKHTPNPNINIDSLSWSAEIMRTLPKYQLKKYPASVQTYK
jgi:hypothetical protein